MSEIPSKDHIKTDLTRVGFVLTLLTFALILGVALPIVRWRDPATGEPLPRQFAIFSPVILGAVFFGASTWLLNLIGLPVWSTRIEGRSGRAKD